MANHDTHEGSCAERTGLLIDEVSDTRRLTYQRHLGVQVEAAYREDYEQGKNSTFRD